jgi:RNA polymerase subunit RPABC4/transcription elongation factor Spt4
MEETKLCPFCGQEIKSSAKKCIHCGKWLEKKCSACGEWIKIDANKCRYCGSWQGDYEKWKYEKATGIKTDPTPQPSARAVDEERMKQMMEEKSDEKNSGCLLYVEGLIVLSLYMWYFDWGWIEWIIAYVVFSILTSIHFTRILVCLAMCGLWAYFAYGVFESWIVAVMSLSCISSTFCSDGLVTFFASHSPQYRHFVAVTLISSPQYGQRFVPVVTILVPLPCPISRHI